LPVVLWLSGNRALWSEAPKASPRAATVSAKHASDAIRGASRAKRHAGGIVLKGKKPGSASIVGTIDWKKANLGSQSGTPPPTEMNFADRVWLSMGAWQCTGKSTLKP
jgi:hypothetical protein